MHVPAGSTLPTSSLPIMAAPVNQGISVAALQRYRDPNLPIGGELCDRIGTPSVDMGELTAELRYLVSGDIALDGEAKVGAAAQHLSPAPPAAIVATGSEQRAAEAAESREQGAGAARSSQRQQLAAGSRARAPRLMYVGGEGAGNKTALLSACRFCWRSVCAPWEAEEQANKRASATTSSA